jgi:hypothetical protein
MGVRVAPPSPPRPLKGRESQVGRVEVRNATAMAHFSATLRFTMNPFNATYVSILDFYNGISP